MPNQSAAHTKLVEDLMLTVGSLPLVRIWKRPVGYDPINKVTYGLVGEADLDGIVAPYGRRLHIECKTGSGKLNGSQKTFKAMVEKFGGIYIIARSVDQVLKELEHYIRESKT